MSYQNFVGLNVTEQENVLKKVFEINNDFMFTIDTIKHRKGVEFAYFDDEEVRNAIEQAMKELNYI